MYERRTYNKPPIEEAVCEFRFKKDNWDPTTPGLLFEGLKATYPAPPGEMQQFEAQFTAGPDKPPSVQTRELPRVTRFSTLDQHKLVTASPKRLAVSMRRPYSHWEEFQNQILEALKIHRSATGAEGLTRIGIRYVNKILIEAQPLTDLGHYFTCAPQDLSELKHQNNDLPSLLESVFSRQDFSFGDSIRMTRIFATAEAPQGFVGVLLDIDVYWRTDDSDSPDIRELIEQLRLKERVAFEASIQDACRDLFK